MPTAPTARAGWYKRNEITITPWLFLAPGVVMFALYVIIPIGQSFWISLYKWNGLGALSQTGEFVGLAHYERLFTRDGAFVTSLWNNLKWMVFYLLAIPAGLAIALFLS